MKYRADTQVCPYGPSKSGMITVYSGSKASADLKRGVLSALTAYLIWGLYPVYWKLLTDVPAAQIMTHRIVWSFLFLAVVVSLRRDWSGLKKAANRRTLLIYLLAGVLLSVNWLVYIWAVNAGFIVETSLGYFINPLVSVLLGVVFLRERLRPLQWVPIGMAAASVLYLTLSYGAPAVDCPGAGFFLWFIRAVQETGPAGFAARADPRDGDGLPARPGLPLLC